MKKIRVLVATAVLAACTGEAPHEVESQSEALSRKEPKGGSYAGPGTYVTPQPAFERPPSEAPPGAARSAPPEVKRAFDGHSKGKNAEEVLASKAKALKELEEEEARGAGARAAATRPVDEAGRADAERKRADFNAELARKGITKVDENYAATKARILGVQ